MTVPTNLSETESQILKKTIEGWFSSFAGTSALDVARDLSLDNATVMSVFEKLTTDGYGSLNKNVRLIQMSFDPTDIAAGFKHKPVTTHIFFPSKKVLRAAFYDSDLPQQRLPEYTIQLHLGAHQIGLAYFSEEVLSRYFKHPEYYEINDSLAGGDISAQSAAPEERYLYVRYGKCRLKSGHIAVTAIYKDLSSMGALEQRYWHSFELESAEIDKSDHHFQNFLARTYEGEFVDFEDPISQLIDAMVAVNEVLGTLPLFQKLNNTHLRLPVEQTYKSYCDATSELYKVIGPDNLSQKSLKKLLSSLFNIDESSLIHSESKRPFSTRQLLELVEKNLGEPGLLSIQLDEISKLRIAADHKILEPDTLIKSYSREFGDTCKTYAKSLERFAATLSKARPQ